MCGIAAILATSKARRLVDPEELLRVRDQMTARGPDGAGLWVSPDQRIGLAHRRLAIIELSEAGAQPMVSSCGRVRLVFNGEIYNYRALRAELQSQGVSFRSHSDTEVILEMYLRHGIAMLDRLRGMFAIALWDEAAQSLLLARDHFGIKPLYWAEQGGTIRIASQVKAILAGDLETTPDPAGHVGFLLWGHVPEPHTLYRQIKPLAAGSWMMFDRDGNRSEGRFFDIRTEMLNPASAGGGLDQALQDSVRHHLEADVPVGVFLSAGLDSTTLAALTHQVSPKPVRTITLAFDEFTRTATDEAPLAEQVACHYGTDHKTCRISAQDFAASRDRILADMDQPSIDGVNTWFVSRAAAQSGLKVAFSGIGGDELFGGYAAFHQIPRLVKRMRLARLVPGLGRITRSALSPWIGRLASPKLAGLLEYGTTWSDAYLLRRALYMPWEIETVLGADMARQGWAELDMRRHLAQAIEGIASPRLAVSVLETQFYMRNQLLRDADWAGMAHSLEIRTPLVDIGLFRAILPLLQGATPPGKQNMAAAAQPPLPDSVTSRAKTGFFIPVAQWLGVGTLRGWAGVVARSFRT